MDQESLWEHYQSECPEVFAQSDTRLKTVLGRIDAPVRLLNIGVGGGVLESLALSRGHQVYSLDPGEKSIRRLRDELDLGERAKVGYSQSIPFADAKFGAVIMSEVLEHLDNGVLGETLREVHRVLAPKGAFVGTVPAEERLEENHIICPHCRKAFHRWGHVQTFDQARLHELLVEFFQVKALQRRYFYSPTGLNTAGRVFGLLKLAAGRVGFHGSGENFLFHAIRRE